MSFVRQVVRGGFSAAKSAVKPRLNSHKLHEAKSRLSPGGSAMTIRTLLSASFTSIEQKLTKYNGSDVVKHAEQSQMNGYGGVDDWKEVKLSDVYNAGDWVCQLCVNVPKNNVHELQAVGASNYFTYSTEFANLLIHDTQKALQLLTPEEFPSRQVIVFYKMTQDILDKFGDLPVAQSRALNNQHVAVTKPNGEREHKFTGQGGAPQVYMPIHGDDHPDKARYAQLNEALLLNTRVVMAQPCTHKPDHEMAQKGYKFIHIKKVDKDGRILDKSKKSYKAKSSDVIHVPAHNHAAATPVQDDAVEPRSGLVVG